MGTYTDFTGAIRITPCLKEPLAGRFRQFLGIRHMKRDVKILEALFPYAHLLFQYSCSILLQVISQAFP